MEVAGIEPASGVSDPQGPTCLACLFRLSGLHFPPAGGRPEVEVSSIISVREPGENSLTIALLYDTLILE